MSTTSDNRELTLHRIIDAPPSRVFEAWTKPELLKQWFAPKPYTTPVAELDVRSGGANRITMRSPEGQDMPNEGLYLEIVPNKKIVFTDAFRAGWVPCESEPFMVVTIDLGEAPGGKTDYRITVRHWTEAKKTQHEEMGFHQGWGICADQLNALVSGQS